MPPVGFEPTIPAGERPQTYVLDRADTRTGLIIIIIIIIIILVTSHTISKVLQSENLSLSVGVYHCFNGISTNKN